MGGLNPDSEIKGERELDFPVNYPSKAEARKSPNRSKAQMHMRLWYTTGYHYGMRVTTLAIAEVGKQQRWGTLWIRDLLLLLLGYRYDFLDFVGKHRFGENFIHSGGHVCVLIL